MMKKGKIIVIEGTDGSGKKTQTKILLRRLKVAGFKVATVDFPQYYQNFFGQMVACYLRGEFGRASQVNPYLASLLYAGDRWEAKNQIKEWLAQGRIIVIDRYYTANMIHQASKFKSQKERIRYLRWLEHLEFKVFNIPKADLILFLDLPYRFNKRLLAGKKADYLQGKKDIHESNRAHLEAAYKQGLQFCRRLKSWHQIKCYQGNSILSRVQIADKVFLLVKRYLRI